MADELRPETLEVPDRVRRQIEEAMTPGEGERLRITGAICGDGSWAYLVDGPALSEAFVRDYVPASRLEAAESALTEALDALDEGGGPAEAARIRSQIEGSKP